MIRKPRTPRNRLLRDLALLHVEAASVVGLRMLKVALGGAAAASEMQRMITEKATALTAAQIELATSLVTGKPHLAPTRVTASYLGRVRANRRRLSGPSRTAMRRKTSRR